MDTTDYDDVTNEIDFDLATGILAVEAIDGCYRDWVPRWSYRLYKDKGAIVARVIRERNAARKG